MASFTSGFMPLQSSDIVSSQKKVLKLLRKCGFPDEKWFELGRALGVAKEDLDAIKTNNLLDDADVNATVNIDGCLQQCIFMWLFNGGATYDSLLAALRFINMTAVADKIVDELLRENSATVTSNDDRLPAGETARLNESHAPFILEAIREIVYDWWILGLYLGLERHELQEIKYNRHLQVENQVQDCRKDVINLWIRTRTATKQRLIEALEAVDRPDVVDRLKQLIIGTGSGSGISNETMRKTDEADVSKWLQEGTINLTIKRVQMLGPSGSGKTCSQRLLLNEDPPKEDNSTPIACRAVKATRISAHDDRMERVDAKALLSRLACDLKESAAKQKETPTKDHGTKSKEESSETIPSPTDSSETKATESANPTESADISEPADDPDANKICRDIVKAIPEAKANLNCNWVYIVDSGGQTAFQELLPLFTRAASLSIITLDLSKDLDEKLDLQYRIDGTSFPCDSKFSYSNIEFLKDVLSSGAVLQPFQDKYPGYFVLGTHSDKATPEKIQKYNDKLSLLTSGYKAEKGYRIIPAKLGEIMYPVNTMLKSGPDRQKISKKLCDIILYDKNSNDTLKIPVRWFTFELTLLKKAGNGSCLKKHDVLSIGKSLEMEKEDTEQALLYLHNATIILYYPQVLPDIVFVDPHPILDTLSRLLALTYNIDRAHLSLLTKEGVDIFDSDDLENLRKRGIFTKSLLDMLNGDQGFPKSDFIELLLHLHIIVDTQDGYFIPSALSSYTGLPPKSDVNPLLIVWRNHCDTKEILPVPRGIFPLVVANLMKFKQPQFRTENSSECLKYRDAISFRVYVQNKHIGTIHVIKKHKHIEIYFETIELKHCPLIREVVTEAINSSSVAINLKPDGHKLAFACCSKENCYRIVTDEAEEEVECSCSKPPNISGQEKYWSWFHGARSCQSPTEGSKTLDITDLQKVLHLLRECHFKNVWEELGLELGLYQDPTLSDIKHSPTRGAALIACLTTWLQRADAVDEYGGTTYVSLANAFERLNQKAVADKIRRKCQIDDPQEEIISIEPSESSKSKPVPAQDSCHIAEEEEKEKQIAEKSRTGSSCPWTILLGVMVFMFICVALFAIVGITAYMRIINDEGQAIFDKGNNGWTELEITDLKEILGLLHDGHFPDHRWLDLGIRLKILHTTLTTIEADTNSAHRRLLEMLSLWLRRGKATWSELGTALSEMEEYKSAELVKTRVAKKKHEL